MKYESANAKRPYDCSVLCLRTKSWVCSFPHCILDVTSFGSADSIRRASNNVVGQFKPLFRAGVKCGVRDVGCGEIPTHKMRGKVRGLTPQFTCMNAPWPHDDHEPGDTWPWDNRRYAMKHQSRFSEVDKVTWSRSLTWHFLSRHFLWQQWHVNDTSMTCHFLLAVNSLPVTFRTKLETFLLVI